MKVLLQRVNYAHVTVDNERIGEISSGLLLLVGFGSGDTEAVLRPMAEKILQMRLFPEGDRKFHVSALDAKKGVLLIPQFTLYADTSKGRRPDFFSALAPEQATLLFDQFVATMRSLTTGPVACGQFGAYMKVGLENDGPVTLMLDSTI